MSKISLLVVGALLVTGSAFAETTDTTLAPPGCYQGSGCDQNGWATTTANNTELGLTAIIRNEGAPGEGTNPGSIVGDTYFIPEGDQPSSPSHSLWNFSWSINTSLNGSSQLLSAYSYLLTVTDTTSGLSFQYNPFDGTFPLPNDNATDATLPGQTAENSENLRFGFLSGPLNYDDHLGDDYTITLTENNAQTGALVATDSINVDVVTPEPSTISLAGLALLGLWFVNRRRMQRS